MKITPNNIITVDFETYYDVGYTLSGKMNTSEYIRDSKFHAHGVGIKIGTSKPVWYTGAQIPMAIHAIDWTKYALLAHNTAFDGFILSHHYDVVPGMYLDTLSMSRALHGAGQRHDLNTLAQQYGFKGKVRKDALLNTKGKTKLTLAEERELGKYCIDDVNDTHGIFTKMVNMLPKKELDLIHMTMRMFCEPVLKIDIPRVEGELQRQVGGKVAALMKAGVTGEQLLSNPKFAQLLIDRGHNPPMKVSPTTGKFTYAFAKSDKDFQALAALGGDIGALCEARLKLKSTIGETRAERFIEAGKDGMDFPILLNYCGAHTTRWSGGNKLNLQNLPRGGELRKSILAPPGYRVVVADSSQIEARILAWLAGQSDIVSAFASKSDVYKLMACSIYGKRIEDITKDERFVGKVCVLGLGYGMGWVKLKETLRAGAMGPPMIIDDETAQKIVRIYRRKNKKITDYWKIAESMLHTMAKPMTTAPDVRTLGPLSYGPRFLELPNGLFLQYFGLQYKPMKKGVLQALEAGEIEDLEDFHLEDGFRYMTATGMRKIYGGLLVENIVQALARVVISEQMLEVDKIARVVTMTHDEIVVIAPERKADQVLSQMIQIMSTSPAWAKGLPLAAEGGHAPEYSK